MRSILLYIHDDEGLEARLQVALDLARRFDGHLTCIQAIPFDLGLAGDFNYPMAAKVASELLAEAKAMRAKIEARLQNEDVPWDWIHADGLATRQIALHAPLHDLVVLGGVNPTGSATRPSALVSGLVSHIRAPMLVVPAMTKWLSLENTAMIAWNGAPEGSHALRAALPMLARSSQVHIVTVQQPRDQWDFDLPPIDAAKYLARHGIEAEIIELRHEPGGSIARALMEAAANHKAAYMVMGAYGRSHFRERILGGVSYDMLSGPEIPLLLCH